VDSLQAGTYCVQAVLTFKILHSSDIIYLCTLYDPSGPCSSVGIAIDYRLDGPGWNPGGVENLRPCRPALEPTQPPV